MRLRFSCGLLLAGVAFCGSVGAQSSPDQPGYTLHANARVVLTDVTVTDAKGNPVHGLERSAFHIFDNGKAQELVSFDEHRTGEAEAAVEPAAKGANTVSNEYLLHPPPVFNVLMLDTSTIEIFDQMYLNQQLNRFIERLPAGVPLAIYVHAGEAVIQLQNFTADHALLLAALHRAIPKLKQPGAWILSDLDALRQMSIYLAQLPGRKNLLWFTGGSNLYLTVDAVTGAPGNAPTLPAAATALGSQGTNTAAGVDWQAIYDQLEASRIALYPIDARGLTPDMSVSMQQQQQTQMLDEADETGGHAFLNTNQLAEAAAEVIEKDGSFYTLTYTPRDYKLDHKWHRVKVQVEGGTYTLSYRRGYYDDGSPDSAKPEGSRAVLRAEGDEKMQMPEARSEPIIFEASVQPAGAVPTSLTGVGAPKKDETAYAIHYVVPVSAFARETVAKGERLRIGAGVLVFNAQGRTVDRVSDEFRPTFDAELLQAKPASKYGFDQRVNLPKGADYLYVVIWDMTSGRMGTVQVPVVVGKR